MAIGAPSTWANGDLVTATRWNQETRDQINGLRGRPGALLYKTVVSEFSTMSDSFSDPGARTLVNVQLDKTGFDYAYDGSQMAYGSQLMCNIPGWYAITAAFFWNTINSLGTATPLVGTRHLAMKTNSSGRMYHDRVITAGITDADRCAWAQEPCLSPAGSTAIVQPMRIKDLIYMVKGDYLEMFAGQDSGNLLQDYVVNANTTVAAQSAAAFTTYMAAFWVGG